MHLLGEHRQPQILMASWLIICIVRVYQKWQVFTVRAAAYYKQKPHAPFILVIKTNKSVPLSGREKKKRAGLQHNDFRHCLVNLWLVQMVISSGISESAGNKSRSFPTETAERFCKTEISFLALAANIEHAATDQLCEVPCNGWPGWGTGLEQRSPRIFSRGLPTLLWKIQGDDLHQTMALWFPKAQGLFWPLELGFETNNNKTVWNLIGHVEHEVSKNWETDSHHDVQQGTHSPRTPCSRKGNPSLTSVTHTCLFIHTFVILDHTHTKREHSKSW